MQRPALLTLRRDLIASIPSGTGEQRFTLYFPREFTFKRSICFSLGVPMRRLSWLCLSIIVLIGCGCSPSGPERINVFGEVSFNGEPIEDGEIAFQPEAGTEAPPSSAPIIDGKYKLAPQWGLVPGTYKVLVRSYRVSLQDKNLPGGVLDRPPSPDGIDSKEQMLPEEFNTKSTIENFTLASGQGAVEQNYDLKSDTEKKE